jgi:hypothetical protein
MGTPAHQLLASSHLLKGHTLGAQVNLSEQLKIVVQGNLPGVAVRRLLL